MCGGPTLTQSMLCLEEIPRTKQRRVISKTKFLVTSSSESGPRPRLPFDFIEAEETKSRGRSSGHHPWKALHQLARRGRCTGIWQGQRGGQLLHSGDSLQASISYLSCLAMAIV